MENRYLSNKLEWVAPVGSLALGIGISLIIWFGFDFAIESVLRTHSIIANDRVLGLLRQNISDFDGFISRGEIRDRDKFNQILKNNGVVKYKFINPQGRIISSSNQGEIGRLYDDLEQEFHVHEESSDYYHNMHFHFENELILGEVSSRIMDNGNVAGTIELYFDFTKEYQLAQKTRLNVFFVTTLMVVGFVGFTGLMSLGFIRVRKRERDRADTVLQESEAKYRDLVETSQDLIWQNDRNGRLTYLNPAWESTLGFSLKEMIGHEFPDFKRPEEREQNFQKHARIMQGVPATNYETIYISKTGEEVILNFKAKPLFDASGQVVGAQGTATDITEQKRADEKLQRNQELLRSMVDTIPHWIYIKDKDNRYTMVNRAFAEFYGMAPEAFLGMHTRDVPGRSALEYNQYLHSDWMVYENKQSTFSVIEPVISPAGEERTFRTVKTSVRDKEDNVVGLVGISEDITERKHAEEALKESEQKFRNLVEQAADALFVHGSDGRFIDVNREACKSLGYTREELLSLSTPDVLVDFEAKRFRKDLINITPEEPFINEVFHRRKDGTTFPVEASVGAVYLNGQKHLLILARDITYRKKLEAQFQLAQKMEAVGTLAGGIAHNFNNLLQVIMGNTSQILMEMDSSHPHHEILTEIKDRVKSGSELTKQLLGFARGGKFQTKSTNLNTLLVSVTNLVGRTHKEINIHQKLEPTPWNTKVDKGQIEQVLLNLFVNAWQAMPHGGQLYVRSENVTLDDRFGSLHDLAPGRYVKLSVTDTGTGMEKEILDRIFEPFFTTKKATQGTGLGLASAYGIIKNHEGIIIVDSEVGKGTTFEIYLPATDEEKVKIEESPKAEQWKGTGTILFVDDEEGLVNSGRRALGMLGFDVLVASSGNEALEAYEKNKDKIDLIILDMIMPGIGGGAVFDKLKELNLNVKVILSSGYSLEGEAREIMDRGCDGFIQKPYDLETLSESIHDVLDQK